MEVHGARQRSLWSVMVHPKVTPFTGHERLHVTPADISDPKQYVSMGVPYDSGAIVFRRLLELGLREDHSVLDFGAGSLRVGRFLITYLATDRYCGIEPNTWLVEAGLSYMGSDIVEIKQVQFSDNADFDLDVFGRTFDYILISSILMHASHTQMRKIFDTAARALAPGGMIVGDYRSTQQRGSGGDYLGDAWVYPHLTWHNASCIEEACQGKVTELDRDLYGALWFQMEGDKQ